MLLCAPPILFYYLCAETFALNIPWLDDIDLFFQHFLSGETFYERRVSLISQHNDHRLLIPRLLAEFAVSLSGKIDFRQLIALGNFGLILILLAEYSVLKSSKIPSFYIIPVVYILFSLATWLNMTWATTSIQHNYAILFGILSIKYFTSADRHKILIGLLFATMLIFTSGAGLMIFPCLAIYILTQTIKRFFASSSFEQFHEKNDQIIYKILLFLFCSITSLAIYYLNYISPSNYHSILDNLSDPGRAVTYFFVFLGSYTREIGTAFTLGLISFIIFVRLTVRAYYLKNPQLYFVALLIVLMAFGATITRSAFGIGQAMSSRYCITSLTFLIFVYMSLLDSLSKEILNRSSTRLLALFLGFTIYASALVSLESLLLRRTTMERGMKQWLAQGVGLYYPDPIRTKETILLLIKKGLYLPPNFDETRP